MSAKYYIAGFVPENEGGDWVHFPDLPMVNTEGETLEEATENAASALQSALDCMVSRNVAIPEAKADIAAAKSAVRSERTAMGLPYPEEETVFQLVRMPELDNRPVRLNVSLPKSVVAEIDAKAGKMNITRSGFLAKAVQAFVI
jgi:predicted RNase H-like HicB family nuclease